MKLAEAAKVTAMRNGMGLTPNPAATEMTIGASKAAVALLDITEVSKEVIK